MTTATTTTTTRPLPLPAIIQGGMGIHISSAHLANSVSRQGQLGVISGTAIERIITCLLQEGDKGGHIRRHLATFPDQELAQSIIAAWYQPDGLPAPGAYRLVSMFSHIVNTQLQALTVACSYVEVRLAKEGHNNPVGLNLLEKIQAPTLPVLYGAMLADIDVVIMGAGIPRDLPHFVAALARHQPCIQKLSVTNSDSLDLPFDPGCIKADIPPLNPPHCFAIVSSDTLATSLARSGGFTGFVIENAVAGGHNAPPRGSGGEAVANPVYGPRDEANLERIRKLGIPFWLAGGKASAEGLREAQAAGAVGIQVGTAFSLCDESGMSEHLKVTALENIRQQQATVTTEGRCSPTGFPFKVVNVTGTEGARAPEVRIRQPCTMGYLRHAVKRDDGSIVWRCPAESVDRYVAKGGDAADTEGRRCVCQGLVATADLAHATREGDLERGLVTAGDALLDIPRFMKSNKTTYSAGDVLDTILEEA